MAGTVERAPDRAHLTVHHPARGHHVGTRLCLSNRGTRVQLQSGVVVDTSASIENATVTVRGVFIKTEVGDEHNAIAERVA